MKFVILLVVFASLAIVGNCQRSPPLRGFQIHKVDMSDPRCKYLMAEIILLDQSIINLSGFIPKKYLDVPAFIKRFQGHKFRTKRGLELSDILKFLNKPPIQDMIDRIERIVAKLPGCIVWAKGYLKFWIAGVLGIAKIQTSRFLELRP